MILDLRSTKFRAVATSGVAERGEHIWRRPSPGADIQVKQATVVATDLITADIWATAIVSGGSSAVEKFESSFDSELAVAVVTYSDGRVVSSPGFAGVLANLA
jgi:thiamine biosynthesis lipoprotein